MHKAEYYKYYILLIIIFLIPFSKSLFAQEINGRITSAIDGFPLAGIDLNLYDESGISVGDLIAGSDNTDPNGYYSLAGFPAGNYILKANPFISSGYVKEYYNGSISKSDATLIPVGSGQTVTINFSLNPGTTIEGHVTDISGTSVEGIDIDLFLYPSLSSYTIVTARTDPNGNYAIGNLPPGSYIVKADPDPNMGQEFAPVYFPGTLVKSNATPVEVQSAQVPVKGIHFTLQYGGSIEGLVKDTNSNPIPNIDIDVFNMAGDFIGTVDARTSEEGIYLIGLLPPGSYFVKADPDLESGQMFFDQYYPNGYSTETALPVNISSTNPGITTGIDFTLKVCAIFSGNITSAKDNTPLEGIDLDFYDQDFNRRPYNAVTDSSGKYSVGPVKPGAYYIWADPTIVQGHAGQYYPSGMARSQAQPLIVAGGDILTGLDLSLPPAGAIEGNVTDTSGQQIADTKLLAYDPNLTLITKIYTRTESDGTFTIGPLPEGDIYLEVKPPDGSFFIKQFYPSGFVKETAQPIAVTANVTKSGINFELDKGGKISGNVIDVNTQEGLGNVDIDLFDGITHEFLPFDAETDANGHYVIGPLPIDLTYLVQVEPGQDSFYVTQFFPSGISKSNAQAVSVYSETITIGIDFSLAVGGIIRGTVKDATYLTPIEDIDMDIFDSNGDFLPFFSRTDSNGVYRVGPLPANISYLLLADSDPERPYVRQYYPSGITKSEAQAIAVAPGTETIIHFTLDIGGFICGTVSDASNSLPVHYIDIDVFDLNRQFISEFAETDANGNYRIGPLPEGDYIVRADSDISQYYVRRYYTDSYQFDEATPVTLTAGTITSHIDIMLEIGGLISGNVKNKYGAYLEDVDLDVYLPDGTRINVGGTTDSNGHYLIGPYLPGNVHLRVDPEEESNLALIYYQASPVLNGSTPITILPGNTTDGIDIIVPYAGRISGQVISSLTGTGVSDMTVRIFQYSGFHKLDKHVKTDINGEYIFHNIPAGEFIILADAKPETGLAPLYYQNSPAPEQASIVKVQENIVASGINIILEPLGVIDMNFLKGFNLFGYPVKVPQDYTSYDLIKYLGTKDSIKKIQRYNSVEKDYETTSYYANGAIRGDEFTILNGEGFLLYAKENISASFSGNIPDIGLSLKKGFNILHILQIPLEYTSYDLLSSIGSPDEIENIIRYNAETGLYESTYYINGKPSGRKFEISTRESYLIYMKVDKVVSLPE